MLLPAVGFGIARRPVVFVVCRLVPDSGLGISNYRLVLLLCNPGTLPYKPRVAQLPGETSPESPLSRVAFFPVVGGQSYLQPLVSLSSWNP